MRSTASHASGSGIREITLGPDGGIQHLVMDITTPSEPENQRERHVVADVTKDSVIMVEAR